MTILTQLNAPPIYLICGGIIAFVAKNSHISADTFRALMLATGDMANDVGSIVYGEQAVELGLMDRIGTLSDALDCLYEMIDHHGKQKED